MPAKWLRVVKGGFVPIAKLRLIDIHNHPEPESEGKYSIDGLTERGWFELSDWPGDFSLWGDAAIYLIERIESSKKPVVDAMNVIEEFLKKNGTTND